MAKRRLARWSPPRTKSIVAATEQLFPLMKIAAVAFRGDDAVAVVARLALRDTRFPHPRANWQ
jgi:hypothetical protein